MPLDGTLNLYFGISNIYYYNNNCEVGVTCHSIYGAEMLYDYRSGFVCLFVKQQHGQLYATYI
jgi:hypothetical protein